MEDFTCFCCFSLNISNETTPTQIKTFLKHIRPLDLIVFRGGDGVSSLITKLEGLKTGHGDISHVEVAINREWCSKIKVIKTETHILDDKQTLFSWGSTLSGELNDNIPNAETGHATFGVQLRVLEDLIEVYLKRPNTNVGVCRLINNPTVKHDYESDDEYEIRISELKTKIDIAYEKYNGVSYNTNPLALLAALFPSFRALRNASDKILDLIREKNHWLFCSEFVAVLYELIGVITDETDGQLDGKLLDPRDVVPVDFLGYDTDSDGIVIPICELPPIWVKQ